MFIIDEDLFCNGIRTDRPAVIYRGPELPTNEQEKFVIVWLQAVIQVWPELQEPLEHGCGTYFLYTTKDSMIKYCARPDNDYNATDYEEYV